MMINIIEELQAFDIPHTSYMRAIEYMQEKYTGIMPDVAREMIAVLTGIKVDETHVKDEHAYTTLLYVIQEAIRENQQGTVSNPETIVELAILKTNTLFQVNPWLLAKPDPEEEFDDLTGKTKFKKGRKQDLADEIYQKNKDKDKSIIMQLFMEELDMSKQGARTYYYNMKNKYGDK